MPSYVRSGLPRTVNTQTAGDQIKPSITALADGTFLIVWQTANTAQDGSGAAVKAQRLDATGAALGPEFLINTAALGDQSIPRVASLQSGGFVVTWETGDTAQDGNGSAIKGQVFDAAGVKVGVEFKVNTAAFANQQQPTVTGLADGGFVVAWQTTDTAQDGSGWAIKAQRYDAAGVATGAEFRVNSTAAGSQNNVDVAALSNGGYVVTWQVGNDMNSEIYARAYNADGSAAGNQFTVSQDFGSQTHGRVAALANGGFVVTWMTSDADGLGIRAQIFDASRVKVGTEIAVNTSTTGNQGLPDIIALPDGTFVIAWENWGLADGILAQQFSATGQKLWGELVVAREANAIEGQLAITGLAGGGFAVTWSNTVTGGGTGADIRVQLFQLGTTPNAAPELGAPTRSVSVAENGTTVVTLTATDDAGPLAPAYSITGGADAARFTINAATGQLRFAVAPNFEAPTDGGANNVYEVIVQVTDGELADTQLVYVTVTNVNEAPVITSNGAGASAAISVQENGAAVTTVAAADPDHPLLTYSISGGADAARFTINTTSGILQFVTAPNFEAPTDADGNNVYLVTVRASDGSLSDTQSLSVTVTNRNEAPVISSNGGGDTAAVSVAENGTAVAAVAAADPEGTAPIYAIGGGADAHLFAINSATGALSFLAAPDFELPGDANGDNIYEVTVNADDGSSADAQSLSVTVGNVIEGVVITSDGGGATAALGIDENSNAVTNVVAVNGEAGPPAYAIAGGADAAFFEIDPATGALAFVWAPDYEAPADADGDNVYEVVVSAGNGFLADTQALAVSVLDVEDEGDGLLSGAVFSDAAWGGDASVWRPSRYDLIDISNAPHFV